MKTQSRIFSAATVLVAAALLVNSCKQSPTGADGTALPMKSGGGTTAANPAFAYTNQQNLGTNRNPALVWALEVADSDGTHTTFVYTPSSTSENIYSPSWSPGGGSICFLDYKGVYNWSIMAIDISVNSSGVPVGSNLRTIYAPSASDSVKLSSPRWSQTSSTDQIAFIRLHYNSSQKHLFELCTISASGGSVMVLSSIQSDPNSNTVINNFTYPTWSPDDSKIAVSRQDTVAQCTLMVFNASTGSATDSISLHSGSLVPTDLRWSHSGTSELAFTELPSGSGTSTLYYCAPTTGSTPATNSVHSGFASWSPNNSSILIANSSGLQKNVPQTATVSTISTSFAFGGSIDWKP